MLIYQLIFIKKKKTYSIANFGHTLFGARCTRNYETYFLIGKQGSSLPYRLSRPHGFAPGT